MKKRPTRQTNPRKFAARLRAPQLVNDLRPSTPAGRVARRRRINRARKLAQRIKRAADRKAYARRRYAFGGGKKMQRITAPSGVLGRGNKYAHAMRPEERRHVQIVRGILKPNVYEIARDLSRREARELER